MLPPSPLTVQMAQVLVNYLCALNITRHCHNLSDVLPRTHMRFGIHQLQVVS